MPRVLVADSLETPGIDLMRQAGLKVPGLYGPAMEEWSAYGAPTPTI